MRLFPWPGVMAFGRGAVVGVVKGCSAVPVGPEHFCEAARWCALRSLGMIKRRLAGGIPEGASRRHRPVAFGIQRDVEPFRRLWPRGDRKSTRLNSSHLGISYA